MIDQDEITNLNDPLNSHIIETVFTKNKPKGTFITILRDRHSL